MADPLLTVTAIGAGVAIAQPWVIALWKKYIRRGEVVPYVTGFLEIGFSEAGPTLAIDGTLRALHQDIFVRRIRAILTKKRDKSEHAFEWVAFRSYRTFLTPNPAEPGYLEAASGFIVTPSQPKRVCIVFSDFETRQLISQHLMLASSKYWELRRSDRFEQLDYKFLLDAKTQFELRRELAEAYRKDPVQVEAYTAIDRICYWEEGEYDVELKVEVARPEGVFSHSWTIEISEEQARQLRFNALGMLDAFVFVDAGLASPQKFFSYVAYQEKS
jgi:hypothetical protein